MPYGKGTYGSKVGRPKKNKMKKGGSYASTKSNNKSRTKY